MKKIGDIFLVLLAVACIANLINAMLSPPKSARMEEMIANGELTVSEKSEDSSKPENKNFRVGSDTIMNYFEVIDSVGINREDAEKVKRIDDWYAGPRYSFQTEGTTARIYCKMDGTIETVKVGTDINLYELGYEPWKIENFIVGEDTKEELIYCAEDAVSACLKYPGSAEFPIMDWTFGREFNRYSASSYVTAYNAMGVPQKHNFTTQFWIDDENIKLIYLELDGNPVVNKLESYPSPKRAEVEIESQNTNDSEIRIIDGQLGEYGKNVSLDGEDYIWYMIPSGKYKATCNSKRCVLYVDKDEIYRNSSGYVEMKNVSTHEMVYEDSVEIVINEGEHIFNTIGADITLEPVR